jgi:hypothetical protein
VRGDVSTKHSNAAKSSYDAHDRDQELEQELQNVRQVNEAIEGVIQSLRKAKDNMKVGFRLHRQGSYHIDTDTRLSTIPSRPHLHYSTLGPAFYHRLSTPSA